MGRRTFGGVHGKLVGLLRDKGALGGSRDDAPAVETLQQSTPMILDAQAPATSDILRRVAQAGRTQAQVREDGVIDLYRATAARDRDAAANSAPTVKSVPCFTPGTAIATPKGEKLVEELQVGDRIVTRDNGMQEIRWLSSTPLALRDMERALHLQPILIEVGALGNGLPERPMLVSPNHRVLVSNDKTALYFDESEVFVAAKHLTGLPGVRQVLPRWTRYIHFMFDRHEVVLSNGSWTESFQPQDRTLKSLGNAQRLELMELFPALKTTQGVKSFAEARRSLEHHEAALLHR